MKKAKRIGGFIKEILSSEELEILPGNIAYFFLLSLIPIVTLVFFVATKLNLSYSTITDAIKTVFTENTINYIKPMLIESTMSFGTIVLLIVAFYLASNGAASIIIASNTIFKIKNTSFIKRRIKSFLIVIILIFLFTFILIVPMFGESILNFLSLLKLDNSILRSLNILFPVLKWPLTLIVVMAFIKLVYMISPDESVPSSYVNRGTIFTTISWMLLTGIFSLYINKLVDYSVIYGTLY